MELITKQKILKQKNYDDNLLDIINNKIEITNDRVEVIQAIDNA